MYGEKKKSPLTARHLHTVAVSLGKETNAINWVDGIGERNEGSIQYYNM